MGKNIIRLIVVVLVAFSLSGCSYNSIRPGEEVSFVRGFLPEKSWKDYKAEQKAPERPVKEAQIQEEKNNGTEVKNTHLPGGAIRTNLLVGPFSGGAEVHEENYRDENRLVLTPFFGKESPKYNQGYRDEKRRARILKQQNERQRVLDLAREDASNGAPNYEGVSGRYFDLYLEEYERIVNSFQRRDQNRYFHNEYQRGQDDFRKEHPEYARATRLADKIREQARQDAQDGVFCPPGDGRFVQEYEDAHRQEMKRLKK